MCFVIPPRSIWPSPESAWRSSPNFSRTPLRKLRFPPMQDFYRTICGGLPTRWKTDVVPLVQLNLRAGERMGLAAQTCIGPARDFESFRHVGVGRTKMAL